MLSRTPILSYLHDIVLMALPRHCPVCGLPLRTDEQDLCHRCIDTLPETGYHRLRDNAVAQQFWGRLPIDNACAYLYVQPTNNTQQMIYQLKYKGKQGLGKKLGQLFGYRLLEPESLIRDIDLIIPVPLHRLRQQQRGYNQCDNIAAGLSEVLGVPYATDVLQRVRENVSQTKRSRYDRWENVKGIFSLVRPEMVHGKHILLIDDVITTGATLESCAATLLSAEGVRVSVATIATAGR